MSPLSPQTGDAALLSDLLHFFRPDRCGDREIPNSDTCEGRWGSPLRLPNLTRALQRNAAHRGKDSGVCTGLDQNTPSEGGATVQKQVSFCKVGCSMNENETVRPQQISGGSRAQGPLTPGNKITWSFYQS